MDTHPLHYPCFLIHQFNRPKGVTWAKKASEVSKKWKQTDFYTLEQAQRSMISTTIEYVVATWLWSKDKLEICK